MSTGNYTIYNQKTTDLTDDNEYKSYDSNVKGTCHTLEDIDDELRSVNLKSEKPQLKQLETIKEVVEFGLDGCSSKGSLLIAQGLSSLSPKPRAYSPKELDLTGSFSEAPDQSSISKIQ
jgi:hypothetical protein